VRPSVEARGPLIEPTLDVTDPGWSRWDRRGDDRLDVDVQPTRDTEVVHLSVGVDADRLSRTDIAKAGLGVSQCHSDVSALRLDVP